MFDFRPLSGGPEATFNKQHKNALLQLKESISAAEQERERMNLLLTLHKEGYTNSYLNGITSTLSAILHFATINNVRLAVERVPATLTEWINSLQACVTLDEKAYLLATSHSSSNCKEIQSLITIAEENRKELKTTLTNVFNHINSLLEKFREQRGICNQEDSERPYTLTLDKVIKKVEFLGRSVPSIVVEEKKEEKKVLQLR